MSARQALDTAVRELRARLARPGNDFAWSSWKDQAAALAEVDRLLLGLRAGRASGLDALLSPTGPAQEVALASGWGEDYLVLAGNIERALRAAKLPPE